MMLYLLILFGVFFQIYASQLDVIYLFCYNICILCAIYLNIIEIYVYLNKFVLIVRYLVHNKKQRSL